MINNTVFPYDARLLEEMKTILDGRRKFYGDVLVKSFVGNSENGWKNILTTFTVLQHNSIPTLAKEINYDNVKYNETQITIDSLIDIIDKLVNYGRLSVQNMNIQLEGQFSSNNYLSHLQSKNKMFNLDWSSNFYQFEPKERGQGVPSGELVSLDSPLYPDYTWFMQDKLGLNRNNFHQFLNNVLIFLPNYKARIRNVKLGSKNLTIYTDNNTNEKLVTKVFLGDSENIEKPEIEIKEFESVIPLTFVPHFIYIHLISANTGETLDHRRIFLSWPTPSEDIELEELETGDILQLIDRGENDRTEFKQEINKSTDRFVQCVVAFANTYGGTIFIGVNDSGEILGSYDQKIEETIQNTIRSNCDPTIKIKTETRVINEKNIVVVSVMKGEDMPYAYRGKGVFVRRGSTNRIATRYELDEFYKVKQNGMSRPTY